MNRPNFKTMSQQEPKEYFLTHRDNSEALYAYVDRVHEERNWVEMPPLNSVDDLKVILNLLRGVMKILNAIANFK